MSCGNLVSSGFACVVAHADIYMCVAKQEKRRACMQVSYLGKWRVAQASADNESCY